MKKKLLAAVAAVALSATLFACGTSDTVAQGQAGETYTGTVTEITETSITLTLDDESAVQITLSEDTVFSAEMSAGSTGMEGMGGEDIDPEMMVDAEGDEATDTDAAASESSDMTEQAGSDVPDKPEDDLSEGTDPGAAAASSDGTDPGADAVSGGDTSTTDYTWESIAVGDEVTVTVGDDGVATTVVKTVSGGGDMATGDMSGGMSSSSSSGVSSYEAANTYTEDTTVSNTTLASTGTDENAVLVNNGATVELSTVTITRDSANSTGGDNSSFYGVGASALVIDGTLVISDSTISSDAAGGAGAFAYGDGILYISNTTITTEQDTSGGIHVAGGGTLYAWDLDVTTQGESSAAIRSDRGSGTMVVDGGTYTSNGTGSPAVYSTADITVHDATLTANNSEAICIEGLNTIRLFDCDLTGNMSDNEQNDCTWNVILYQSMSGDSEVGVSTFEMVGGSLTANNGGMFYTTNTESVFIISGVDITYADDNEFFLKVTGNSNSRGWGSTGSNGAQCTFTAIDQEMEGDIIWDSISTLDFYMTDGSTLTGAVVQDESNAGSGGSGYANVYIDATSTWVVTGDSTLTELQNAGTIVDASGNTVSIVGTDGTVYVQGTSAYTITVSSYSTTADLSGASSVDSWEDFEVEQY